MYVIVTLRHKNIYGDGYAVFWGCGKSSGGYSADVRYAHRFTKEEAEEIADKQDVMIPVEPLGISKEQPDENSINENVRVLLELGTINRVCGMKLKSE